MSASIHFLNAKREAIHHAERRALLIGAPPCQGFNVPSACRSRVKLWIAFAEGALWLALLLAGSWLAGQEPGYLSHLVQRVLDGAA